MELAALSIIAGTLIFIWLWVRDEKNKEKEAVALAAAYALTLDDIFTEDELEEISYLETEINACDNCDADLGDYWDLFEENIDGVDIIDGDYVLLCEECFNDLCC